MASQLPQSNDNLISGLVIDSAWGEPNWLIWQNQMRRRPTTRVGMFIGVVAKVPIDPVSGVAIDARKAARLNGNEASEACFAHGGGAAGCLVGYLPRDGSAIVGWDIDRCFGEDADPENAKLAAQVLELDETYAERSPSGKGMRIIAARPEGEEPLSIERGGVGLFEVGTGKFFTMTFDTISRCTEAWPAPRTRALLLQAYEKWSETLRQRLYDVGKRDAPEIDAAMLDAELMGRLQRACQGDRELARAAQGTVKEWPDRSRALYRLAHLMHTAGWQPEEFGAMATAFPMSACAQHLADQKNLERALGRAWFDAEKDAAQGAAQAPPEATVAAMPRLADLLQPIGLVDLQKEPEPPRMIVEQLIPAAPMAIVGTGGVRKSTLLLRLAMSVILSRSLWGYEVYEPGAVAFFSGEDDGPLIRWRVHRMAQAMGLSATQQAQVGDQLLIGDLSGHMTRFIEADQYGNLSRTPLAEEMLELLTQRRPTWTLFDPTTYFGPGERFVNDGEASLMQLGREFARASGGGVGYVHHSSKEATRADLDDQHVGRGGSAFADNSRAVWIIKKHASHKPGMPEIADAAAIGEGRVTSLLVAKRSYAAPPTARLYAVSEHDNAFRFNFARGVRTAVVSPQDRDRNDEAAVLAFLKTHHEATKVWLSKTALRSNAIYWRGRGRSAGPR